MPPRRCAKFRPFRTRPQNGFVDAGIGQATLNLLGLGSVGTLVLVDGRRHVSGVAGSQVADVPSIPIELVEQVEVLTGGASAVYGAHAVTGAVYYVLCDDRDGLLLDAVAGHLRRRRRLYRFD
ncbi:MAG: TonB-dependent receptor plug domain-containing protein [Alteraurantiacibacter sp.]